MFVCAKYYWNSININEFIIIIVFVVVIIVIVVTIINSQVKGVYKSTTMSTNRKTLCRIITRSNQSYRCYTSVRFEVSNKTG